MCIYLPVGGITVLQWCFFFQGRYIFLTQVDGLMCKCVLPLWQLQVNLIQIQNEEVTVATTTT